MTSDTCVTLLRIDHRSDVYRPADAPTRRARLQRLRAPLPRGGIVDDVVAARTAAKERGGSGAERAGENLLGTAEDHHVVTVVIVGMIDVCEDRPPACVPGARCYPRPGGDRVAGADRDEQVHVSDGPLRPQDASAGSILPISTVGGIAASASQLVSAVSPLIASSARKHGTRDDDMLHATRSSTTLMSWQPASPAASAASHTAFGTCPLPPGRGRAQNRSVAGASEPALRCGISLVACGKAVSAPRGGGWGRRRCGRRVGRRYRRW
jgi:hypothetical protein